MSLSDTDYATQIEKLEPPALDEEIDVVIDTDTYNEIDDQYAVVYGLFSDTLNVEAIYAAPFAYGISEKIRGAKSPAEGMELSYKEIHRLLDRINVNRDEFVYRGSEQYLPKASEPVESEAAHDLVERALGRDEPLYIAALGAPTNVASALLMEPSIAENIVVVWLGGDRWEWPNTSELNLKQDVHASQLLFDSGVPFVHVPGRNISEKLTTTVPELKQYVKHRGEIGNFLFERFADYQDQFGGENESGAWSKEIWDISVIGYLINSEWAPTAVIHSPILSSEFTWSRDPTRHFIREAKYVDRDAIFNDLFNKLETNTERTG
jgi:inosine-uridine nucleoside N-ribohydrolase